MSNKPSLQDQIKKRKQDELRRTLQAQQVEKAKGAADTPQPKHATSTTAAPVRQTTTARAAESRTTQLAPALNSAARAPFRDLSTRQKTTLIAAGAALMIVIVCVGTALIASNAASASNAKASTATLAPVGLSSADALLQHFKELGVPVSDQKPYDLTNSQVWKAQQAYTFTVKSSGKQGSFLVVSFASAAQAADNMISIRINDKYKSWQNNTNANVVLLAQPDSNDQIISDLFSHMITFLYAPYRPWPSSTPAPTQTAAATKDATK